MASPVEGQLREFFESHPVEGVLAAYLFGSHASGAAHRESDSDYTSAVRNLDAHPGFTSTLVEDLARLSGFRNVLLHEYVELDLSLAVEALGNLDPLEDFVRIVSDLEAQG